MCDAVVRSARVVAETALSCPSGTSVPLYPQNIAPHQSLQPGTSPFLAVYAGLARSSPFSKRNQEGTQALWKVFCACPLCEQICKTITCSQIVSF